MREVYFLEKEKKLPLHLPLEPDLIIHPSVNVLGDVPSPQSCLGTATNARRSTDRPNRDLATGKPSYSRRG